MGPPNSDHFRGAERFRVGARVRLSEAGKQRSKKPGRGGVVVGISKTGAQVRVRWDGLKDRVMVHWTYLDLDDSF